MKQEETHGTQDYASPFCLHPSSFIPHPSRVMPVFRYQAIDKRGHSLAGVMPAMDESNLELRLKGLGLWLTEAVLEKPELAGAAAPKSEVRWLRINGKRQRRELIEFCTL